VNEDSLRVLECVETTVSRAADGDADALRRLAEDNENLAFVAAYGVYPKPDRARLAGQYALGQVLLKLRSGTQVENFQAYLRRAAVNAAIVLLRKDGRYVHLDDFPTPVQEKIVAGGRSVSPDPEQMIWRRQVRDRVLRALQRLPERQRLAFTFVVLEGMSYSDAASAMQCDSKTVGSQLFRARERLRQLLGDLVA
jgi:RNA polymerase sigma-70 factor, ECF subfamily